MITRYESAVRAGKGEMLSIEDVLEILRFLFFGVVPESQEVLRAPPISGRRLTCATLQVHQPCLLRRDASSQG